MQPADLKAKQICLFSLIWMALTTLVVFVPNISPWLATPIVMIDIVFVLGFLWAVNLRINSEKISEYILYSLGLGLGFLIIGGLGINWLLPYIGVVQPLAKLPLMIFFDISAVVLSAGVYIFNKNHVFPWKLRTPDSASLFFGIIPFLFVVASACGAEMLNNGGSGTLTLIMLFGIALYVVALMAWGKSVQGWTYISALYFITLSLLFMYSLRSSHIFGWDINQEYQVFQVTLQNLRWKMSYFPGLDYNACISITILPTIFQQLTNIASEYVFKITFQLLFAIVPVMVYVLAKRYLQRPLAFLAAFLILSQTWFFEQMPALNRQEIAFIFFVAILLVIFDKPLTLFKRYILFSIFAAGLILSHYSTSYVWIALLCVTLVFSYGARLFIRRLRTQPVAIKPMMLVISLLFLLVWQIPLTHTIGQATNFVANANVSSPPVSTVIPTKTIPTKTSSTVTSSSSLTPLHIAGGVAIAPIVLPILAVKNILQNAITAAFFINSNANTSQNVSLAEQTALRVYGSQIKNDTYSDVTSSNYTPVPINENITVAPKLPSFLSSVINFLEWTCKVLLIDIFPIIGIVAMFWVLRRRLSDGNYDFIVLSIGAYSLIVFMIAVPYTQVYYNFSRLYLQMFLILSTLSIMGGLVVTKYFSRYQKLILTLMVVILFCSLNGAFDQFTGGDARITLDQPPATLEQPYTNDTEIAGAQWLKSNRNAAEPVEADLVASLRLESFGNMDTNIVGIFPETIQRNSYIYLDNVNIAGEAYYGYENNVLVYNYPLGFLNNNKNLIYNDGGSRVYR